jgi:PAS domain S-box-containing protein
MEKELRILMLEDSSADAELEEYELKRSGLAFTLKVVDTKETFRKAIEEFSPDLILADYDLPTFDGLNALELAKGKCPDVPFILVTGRVGEEFAIETLKKGATDYVMKNNLKRLVPVINRALEEAKMETERKQAEADSQWKTALLEAQINATIDGILIVDEKGNKVIQNQRCIDLWKIPRYIVDNQDDKQQVEFVMHRSKDPQKFVEKVIYLYDHPNETSRDELEFKDGTILDRYSAPVIGKDGTYFGRIWIFRDVTECRQAEEKLRQNEERYRLLFENIMNGFALHEIVVDKEGNPIDYMFLEVNEAFEQLTGLRRNSLIGKRVTEVLPGTENDPADWIGRYGGVALTGQEIRFEQFSQDIGKWFSVLAFSPRKNQFATIFEDITERKKAEEDLKNKMSEIERLNKLLLEEKRK